MSDPNWGRSFFLLYTKCWVIVLYKLNERIASRTNSKLGKVETCARVAPNGSQVEEYRRKSDGFS